MHITIHCTCTERKILDKGTRPLPSSVLRPRLRTAVTVRGQMRAKLCVEFENTRPGCCSPVIHPPTPFDAYTHARAITHTDKHTHVRACTPLTWHIPGGNVCKCIHVIWSGGDGDAVSHSYSPTRARTNPPPHSLRASFQDRALQSVSATRPVGASSFVLL